MADLTPYDTGARLEPATWVSSSSQLNSMDPEDRARIFADHSHEFGMVDFDDDEGRTIATLHIESYEDHTGVRRYILKLDSVGEQLPIHDSDGRRVGTVEPD